MLRRVERVRSGQRPVLLTDPLTRPGGTRGGAPQGQRHHRTLPSSAGTRRDGGDAETYVVPLITQRPQVQILPPLPSKCRSEVSFRSPGAGLLAERGQDAGSTCRHERADLGTGHPTESRLGTRRKRPCAHGRHPSAQGVYGAAVERDAGPGAVETNQLQGHQARMAKIRPRWPGCSRSARTRRSISPS